MKPEAKKSESQRLSSERLRKIDLPPEEILRQLLLKISEFSNIRFNESPQANARLLSINKLTANSLLVLRSLLDTNEHQVGNFQDAQTHHDD
jgi:hypothetical protein